MGVHGNLFMSSKLIRGASPKCGPALTWSLSDSSAATTHRQRSQNVRNQFEGFRALRSKSMEESVVVEELSGVTETTVMGKNVMRKIKRNQKVSLPHPNCDVT